MSRIERIDNKLSMIAKSKIIQLDEVQMSEGDVFLLCAGFENRALTVLERLICSGRTGFMIVIIKYLPYVKENRFEEIKKLCEQSKLKMVELTYDRHNPAGIGKEIIDILKKIKGHIYIDISAMSRLLIVQTIVALSRSSLGLKNVTILYVEALRYPPNYDEVKNVIEKNTPDSIYRTMFISSGVFEVTVVPELSSVGLQGQPIRLVTFPSFNAHQLAALRAELQPSSFSFIHGIPHLPENAWRPEAIKKLNHIEEILRREDMNASTFDYRETLDCLLTTYGTHGVMERLILSPIGSKLQTVAVGIFKSFLEDIQIAYPTPRTFVSPTDYTKGVRAIYSLCLQDFCI